MLGPSGCGKTTTLRLIAGFERPDGGGILLDGVDMSTTPPHKRRVNTVFQSYALFSHKTVEDNIAFGLRYQKCTKEEMRQRVELGDGDGAPRRARQAPPRPALGRPAAARRARPRARARAAGAAARRAARRPGRAPAHRPPGRAQAHPGAARDHVHLRDPRPGRGADDVRPRRGDARRAHQPVRHAAGALRGARDGVRGELPGRGEPRARHRRARPRGGALRAGQLLAALPRHRRGRRRGAAP